MGYSQHSGVVIVCDGTDAAAKRIERVLWNDYEKKAMDKALASGVTVTQVADKKAFQDAVKPVWDKYMSTPEIRNVVNEIVNTK